MAAPSLVRSRRQVVLSALLATGLGLLGPLSRMLADDMVGRAVLVGAMGLAWVALPWVLPARWWASAVRAASAAALVVVAPTGAHRAVLVALVGLACAHGALVSWQPLPGWPARQVEVAALAVPPLVLGGLAWYHQAPIEVVLAWYLAAFVVVELYHRAPAVVGPVDRGFRRAIAAIGVAAASVVLFLAVLPLLYLPGLVGALRDRFRPVPTSTWRMRPSTAASERRLASRPFAATPPPDRLRRHLVGVAVIVLAAGALVVADRVRPVEEVASPPTTTTAPPDAGDPEEPFANRAEVTFSDLPAFASAPWADQLQRDQEAFAGALRPDPVVGFGAPDYASATTNVVDGERETVDSTCSGCPTAVVWLVGGSVAFGLGQRDDHTIASELVRLAAEDGIDLTVRNIAVPGWTLRQERLAVGALLADPDQPPPDLVVSIGGFNDVAGAATTLAMNPADPGPYNLLDGGTVLRFAEEGKTLADAGGADFVAATAVDRYRRSQRELDAIAAERGVPTAYFFHPDAMASPTQFAPVRNVMKGLPAGSAGELDRLLEAVSQQLEPEVVDLRHLYDRERTSLFLDWAHTNERGAEVAARAVWSEIGPGVRGAAGVG